jgi:hypothetical protein
VADFEVAGIARVKNVSREGAKAQRKEIKFLHKRFFFRP